MKSLNTGICSDIQWTRSICQIPFMQCVCVCVHVHKCPSKSIKCFWKNQKSPSSSRGKAMRNDVSLLTHLHVLPIQSTSRSAWKKQSLEIIYFGAENKCEICTSRPHDVHFPGTLKILLMSIFNIYFLDHHSLWGW